MALAWATAFIKQRWWPTTYRKQKKGQTLRLSFFIWVSLLSDSNQRPRDYKSRALAN